MNENKKFMPESCYSLDDSMSLDKIYRAKRTGDFVIAKAVMWDYKKNCIKVDLGNDYHGEIPLHEFSIYPVLRANNTLSPSVYSFIGKNICACVKEILKDNTIILSRKENMIKSFNHIKELENETVSCSITSTINYGVFVDVGFGITGLVHITNLCISRAKNPADVGFSIGRLIEARIISINFEKYQIELSHKELFDNLAFALNTGDVIEVTCLDPLNKKKDGYYAYLSPNTPALVNPSRECHDFISIPYGSKVIAQVRNFNPKHPDRLRLQFLSFCS